MRRILLVILAVLIVATAGVYAMFVRDISGARARLVGRSRTVETSFGTLEYAVLGEGDPILAIHGAGGGFDQAVDMTGAVVGRGYQLIAPSRFGYLRSGLPDNLTAAMQADAFAQLLDKLGIDRAAVVGISAGAWSSLQFAIRHPDRCRALILLVPADYLPAGTANHGGSAVQAIFNSDFIAWGALKFMPILPGAMTRMMLGTDAGVIRAAQPSEKLRVQQLLEHLLPVSARSTGMQFDIKTATTRESYPIDKIACPLLTISAEDDRFGTAQRARYIARSVSDGRAIIYPSGGHALVGDYAEALHEIMSFLQSVKAQSATSEPAKETK
ncbi:MAG TPA: alpha/beta hydrolase [Steroidobacteraceae bacterium]|nr:alpha/beta hydrolase [Steroidobacteraceae bacterium]